MADESLSIEISAKDLTGQAFASIQRSLGEISAASQQTAKNLGEIGASTDKALGGMPVKAGAAAAGILAVVQVTIEAAKQLAAYHAETRKSTAAIGDQAEALQLTTSQFQAIAFAGDKVGVSQEKATAAWGRFSARLGEAAGGNKAAIDSFEKLGVRILDNDGKLRSSATVMQEVAEGLLRMDNADQRAAAAKDLLGLSGSRLIPLLRQFAGGMDEVQRKAEAAGVVISGETVEAANKLENQSHSTSLAIRKFYAEIGMPIELKFLKAVESVVNGITSAYSSANKAALEFTAGIADKQVAALDKKIAAAEESLRNPSWMERQLRSPQSAAAIQGDIDAMKAERAKLDAAVGKYRKTTVASDGTLGFVMNDGLPATGGGGSNPVPTGKGGSGGAGGGRDRIAEAISQLQGETRAAQTALAQMVAGAGMPLKDLERSVELEKKIADEIAKLGKYDPKDPRVQQIREQVIAHENAEAALKKYATAARDAESIERNVGSGKAYLTAETERLNAALDTGRLSYDAYAVAMRDATEKAEDMRLKLEGQRGGVEGLVAGMQYAANQWQRANRPFESGQRLMNDGFNLLKTTTDDWARTGVFNVQKFEQAFLSMLINIGFALAQSELMKWLGGGSGGIGGGGGIGGMIMNLMGLGGGGSAGGGFGVGGLTDGVTLSSTAPVFADGGRPPLGQPSIVGEKGWELFVPDQPGTIFNQDQLAGMGGVTVVQNHTNQFGSVVSRAEMEQHGMMVEERARRGAIAGVLDAKSRGGSYRNGLRR